MVIVFSFPKMKRFQVSLKTAFRQILKTVNNVKSEIIVKNVHVLIIVFLIEGHTHLMQSRNGGLAD